MTESTPEIENLRKKLDENPDSLVFAPLADALRKAGRLDEALETCRKGLERHDHYTPARVVLGRVFRDQGKSAEAEAEYKKVLEDDPENLQALSLLGELFLSQKQFSAAIEEFQKVLALNPDDDDTQVSLKKAIEAAAQDQAKSSAPPAASPSAPSAPKESAPPAKDSAATLTIAELYLKQGHFDKAIEVYQELLAEDPQNLMLRQKLSAAVEQQQKHQAAAGGVASKIKKDEFTRPPDPIGDSIAEDPKEHRRGVSAMRDRKKMEDSKFTNEDILQVMLRGGKDDVMVEDRGAASAPPRGTPPPLVTAPVRPSAPEGPKPATVFDPSKTTASPASSSAVSGLSPDQKEGLKGVLAELTSVEGIQGSFLAGENGAPLVSMGKTGSDETNLGQTASVIFKITRQAAQRVAQGNLQQVLVTAATGQILLVGTAKGVLVVLADDKIKIGMLRLALDSSVKKIQKVLQA